MASSMPINLPLSTALVRSEPLVSLLKRLRESQARFSRDTSGSLRPSAVDSGKLIGMDEAMNGV